MKRSICGADCEACGYGKNNACRGCTETCGCPFGKSCFIARYIKTGGEEAYRAFRARLVEEFNALGIPGMPEIGELYAINGAFVNLAYPMTNGDAVKLLDDREIYLCNQVECEFNDGSLIKCFGLVAGPDFLLVAEYGANCSDPELLVYKKR
ncbi:MAG: DUF3795 domain-containing protein [Eubacteriales bacterium]